MDLLHVESIASRSRGHGWEIRPHRHGTLCQVLLVRRGRLQTKLDGQTQHLRGPAAVTVPSLAAHGFSFSDDVDGWVFTLVESRLQALLVRDPAMAESFLRLRAAALPARAPDTTEVLAAADALRAEMG
ncbi:MAG: AraC family ligand binding domain-containing protein, partial [Chitinophagaceae bacterium]|nr:AraC family ligand binding domain-containing protein [Rubrivivax sp.]